MLAIPTHYNGIVYRSRTEAQWAFVLDEHGIAYRYEPITFFFDLVAPEHWRFAAGYLPDFWLPAHRLWLEIKPHAPNAIEYEKAALLAECTGSGVLIATGGPTQSEAVLLVTALDASVIVSTLPDGSHPAQTGHRPLEQGLPPVASSLRRRKGTQAQASIVLAARSRLPRQLFL